ncbi:hypothetical protein [Halostella litorea]|uniref:hypothetical protein n=1 Tax=Halostella litorea TaxID=2528831 RepID=UPI0010927C85|nr:hypothetical protein [Halostella litorea]
MTDDTPAILRVFERALPSQHIKRVASAITDAGRLTKADLTYQDWAHVLTETNGEAAILLQPENPTPDQRGRAWVVRYDAAHGRLDKQAVHAATTTDEYAPRDLAADLREYDASPIVLDQFDGVGPDDGWGIGPIATISSDGGETA